MYNFIALCACLCTSLTFASLQEGQGNESLTSHRAIVKGILADQSENLSETLMPLLNPLTIEEAQAQLARLQPALQLCTTPEDAQTILRSYQLWLAHEGAEIQQGSDHDPLHNLVGQVKRWIDPVKEFRLTLGFFDGLEGTTSNPS